MCVPVKGKEPGAFVLTSKSDGKEYVMSEKTLLIILDKLGEENFDTYFTGEWVGLSAGKTKERRGNDYQV